MAAPQSTVVIARQKILFFFLSAGCSGEMLFRAAPNRDGQSRCLDVSRHRVADDCKSRHRMVRKGHILPVVESEIAEEVGRLTFVASVKLVSPIQALSDGSGELYSTSAHRVL